VCVDCLNVCFLYFVYDFIIIIIINVYVQEKNSGLQVNCALSDF